MTNKTEMVSVPRELLERLAYGEWECASLKDRDTLRAILSASAEDVRAMVDEPVGKILSESEMGIGYDRKAGRAVWFGSPEPGFLYRHAQCKVVMPERKIENPFTPQSMEWHSRNDENYEWNACLDEFERLNGEQS